MPTQLFRAHQRKADRYCPFPKRRQQGGFWNVPKREVWSQGIWRTVVLLGTGIKPALSHTIYSPLFYILFFLQPQYPHLAALRKVASDGFFWLVTRVQ